MASSSTRSAGGTGSLLQTLERYTNWSTKKSLSLAAVRKHKKALVYHGLLGPSSPPHFGQTEEQLLEEVEKTGLFKWSLLVPSYQKPSPCFTCLPSVTDNILDTAMGLMANNASIVYINLFLTCFSTRSLSVTQPCCVVVFCWVLLYIRCKVLVTTV